MEEIERPMDRNDSADLADDFEVVSSLTGSEDTEEASVNASRRDTSSLRQQQQNGLEECFHSAVDPHQTFVMIQREHEELKKELAGQHSLLATGLEALRDSQEKKNQEVNELKREITDLRTELEQSREENANLKHEMKSFNEYKEKVDELTAKLCYAEDVVKYHEQVTRQFQSEGFVNIQPPMLTDAMLAKEMSDKENQLKQLREKLSELEQALIRENERSTKAEKDSDELRGLVNVLQEQRNEDGAYLSEMRANYEEQLRILQTELKRFMGSGSHATAPPQQSSAGSSNNSHQRASVQPIAATDGGEAVFQCEKCRIRVCDANLYMKHVENCRPPPSIDQID